ncbi:uncharacterized protein LOC142543572 isoform X1 [Primulina tabacum]|uniref:uncharacterized protein LOC142543572 isoform X1 n=1 Tax=Primulina tabacum TaxID=48773 RepID=UPI003F5972B6
MATDSEPTRRKHHRSSSPDNADEHSKRRKHRHHRHRHHRHKSKQDNEEVPNDELVVGRIENDEVEDRKLGNSEDESGAVGDVVVSNGFRFIGVDYEMEEGEIVEDDDLGSYVHGEFEKSKKNLDSDLESGEIKTLQDNDSNLNSSLQEVSEDNVKSVEKNSRKLDKDGEDRKAIGDPDEDRAFSLDDLGNKHYSLKNHEDVHMVLSVDGKRTRKLDHMVYPSDQRKSLSSVKRHRVVSSFHSHEEYLNGSSPRSLSKSPVRTRERSRSRSILREPLIVEDTYLAEVNRRNNPGDERVIAPDRNNSDSGWDGMRLKDIKHHSSSYFEGTERSYKRDGHEKHRKGSRERDSVKDKDRTRETEREKEREWERERERERERTRNRDRARERERERGRNRDRERKGEGRNKDTDRGRTTDRDGGRPRSRDVDKDNETDRFRRRQMYDDEVSFRDRDDDSMHRRNVEDHSRERSKKSYLENTGTNSNSAEKDGKNYKREEDIQEDYQDKIVMQLAEQEEDDLDRIKEESRRRKQAILEKYKIKSPKKNELKSEETVKKQDGQSSEQVVSAEVAADSIDNQVEGSDLFVPESNFSVGKSPLQNGLSAIQRPAGIGTRTGGLGEGSPKSERSADMFCDDIFGESPTFVRKTGKADNAAIEKSELHDNWDDAEGYYGYRFGEILDGRYEIIAAHGRGVFSTVVRAKDLKAKSSDPEEVAIKIIRNNETMYKAGMEELVILKKLVKADPENKRHCVRFLSSFKYRNHLCLVFESLHMNLREVLKKFGRNIGLKLTAVRTYAKQLFIALKHLKNCRVLHCDIKPDNMLVNEAKNILKLCDFGNAMFAGKNEITPYLVSRFYRAPEIILGLPYDHPMDIWSIGCCLFELYTGKVLFPGSTNNDMLRLHMELKGPFPKRMLRKGAFADQHFDQDLNFLATEEDPVTKKGIRRLIVNVKPKDFGTLLLGSPGEDPKMLANIKDLMEKIFVLDPDKRLSVSQALSHPFITGK